MVHKNDERRLLAAFRKLLSAFGRLAEYPKKETAAEWSFRNIDGATIVMCCVRWSFELNISKDMTNGREGDQKSTVESRAAFECWKKMMTTTTMADEVGDKMRMGFTHRLASIKSHLAIISVYIRDSDLYSPLYDFRRVRGLA
jgi:hypothetical protein